MARPLKGARVLGKGAQTKRVRGRDRETVWFCAGLYINFMIYKIAGCS